MKLVQDKKRLVPLVVEIRNIRLIPEEILL